MADVHDWSTTPANNDTADSDINWAEGQAPSTVNNSSRGEMAKIANWRELLSGSLTTGGTGDAYTLTPAYTPSTFAAGYRLRFTADRNNTGAATLKVGALATVNLRDIDGAALVADDIVANHIYHAYYDGTNFLILNLDKNFNFENVDVSGTLDVAGAATFTSSFVSKGISDTLATKIIMSTGDEAVVFGDGSAAETFRLGLATVTDGGMQFGSSPLEAGGANVTIFGSTHATKANDIEFSTGTTIRALWDQSALNWDFQSHDVIGVDSLTLVDLVASGTVTMTGDMIAPTVIDRGAVDSSLTVSGGSTAVLGANFVAYGETHATQANDFELSSSADLVWFWDDSADQHNWYAASGTVRMTLNATTGLTVSGDITGSSITGSSIAANNDGSAIAPALAVDADGAGGGTGIFGENTGTNDFLAFTIDGVESMRILPSGDLQIDTGNVIHRDITSDSLTISGGNSGTVGANAVFYGSTHASLAGDIALRNGTTNELYFDSSAAEWSFNDNKITDVVDVFRGNDTDVLTISGSSDGNTGINIRIFGGSHASNANNFNIREGTSNILRYDSALGDASQGRFEFNSKQIYNPSSVRLVNYTVANAPSAATAGEGAVIYVSNGDSGGRCLAISNGSAWKRVVHGATISAT